MPDPLSVLVIVASTVAGLSVLLARLIPDEYDPPRPAPDQAAEASIPSFGSRST